MRRVHASWPCLLLLVTAVHIGMPSVSEGSGDATNSLCQTGEGFFDFGPHREDPEAEQLAMGLSGQLRAPDAEYERIRRDLGLIREQYPVLVSAEDQPDYVPNQLIVRLTATGPWPGYDALNAYYQVIEDRVLSPLLPNTHVLTFCDNLNANILGPMYEALETEVVYAAPNSYYGTIFISVVVMPPYHEYSIEDGFGGDCPSGCMCKRNWLLDVHDDGTVALLYFSETGPCITTVTACCSPELMCDVQPIASCLDAGGAPQELSASCSVCESVAVPAMSRWGLAGVTALVVTVALAALRNDAAPRSRSDH